MTDTEPPEMGEAAGHDDVDATDGDVTGRGSNTALWITLVIVATIFGGALGWRIARDDGPDRPGRDSVDVGFFQDMVTHHNQAVAIGFSYLEHGTDPLLRHIASEIVLYQSSEIGVMNDHLRLWGQQGTERASAMAWMGMAVPRDEMAGMATRAELDALAAARGRDADQLFTRLMIRHHEGGIHMAEYAEAHAETETARSWATAMIDGQKGEIAELNRWRVRNGFDSVAVRVGAA